MRSLILFMLVSALCGCAKKNAPKGPSSATETTAPAPQPSPSPQPAPQPQPSRDSDVSNNGDPNHELPNPGPGTPIKFGPRNCVIPSFKNAKPSLAAKIFYRISKFCNLTEQDTASIAKGL